MLFRCYFTVLLLLLTTHSHAQEKITLNNQDGIYVSYELTKIEDGGKKDTYLAVVKAENKNDFDVYYSIPLTVQSNGNTEISILENRKFAQSSVRNSTSLFGDNINLGGEQTKLITNDNKILFSIPKGNFITAEKEFKVKKGVKPIITNTFLLPLKSIDNFDLAINAPTINGDWNSNCGNSQMTLTLTRNEKNETVIQQLINGKQIVWRKTTSNSFAKVNDSNTTLSYNKLNNTFSYSTTDGVNCVWAKK